MTENFLTTQIKKPIQKVLQKDEMFENTFFTLDSVIKLDGNVFHLNSAVIGLNIENTPYFQDEGYGCGITVKPQLLVSYHRVPNDDIDEDKLNLIGFRIIKIIDEAIKNKELFNCGDITITCKSMNVGRMYDPRDFKKYDKMEVHSDAVVIRYEIGFNLNEIDL